ncbi:ROK family transcriptional regulator [Devosia chinhatensis]|uniref:HTH marR-type domain-containing protein n=1 Tax=Devosia chinhatensis TaxID=429727 RepID=A0A0F5FHQ0_9HYPH|nr:ROK family transcriptional regulator [Devosia chinhatensis]KKB08080.1 hypothetical protein VE26_16030 [Devosia chinhatensis]
MSKPPRSTRDIFDAGGRAIRHEGLRRANEKTVLMVVGFNSGVSNAEIARISGLAPQTVSAILSGLERDGLIERGQALRGKRGQPATPILLKRDGGFAIGVELGWTHLDVLLLNMHAQVLEHRRIDFAYPDATSIFDEIARFVAELRASLPAEGAERLYDLGVALPGGMADQLDRVGWSSAQSDPWRNVDVAAELRQRTALDVSLFNDGNAACWAELIALPKPRPANVLYFLVSHYVAAGVVGDGALWHGTTGNAANLGMMLVQLDAGGLRQVYSVASVSALADRLKAIGKGPGNIPVSQWDWPDIQEEADNWLGDSARALARTIFNATTLVEAPLVIIDSVLDPEWTQKLARRVEAELGALPVIDFEVPPVQIGVYGGLAPAIGAAELTLFNRYF